MRSGALRSAGRGAVLMILVMVAGGCSRVAVETSPPAPIPTSAVPLIETEPVSSAPAGVRAGVTGVVERTDPTVDAVDPILSSPAGRDDWLRQRVTWWIDFWTTRGAEQFERYLERMARYGPHVDAEIAARGLPASLRYLPVVESGYHHGAVSRVGATGMWQFMSPTAREQGLTVSAVVDDRRDPLAATRAALDYLVQLHETFDSWFLALAAYNSGPGRVSRVLRGIEADPDDPADALLLKARDRLPAETRDFVPRFLAAAALAGDPESFGLRTPDDVQPFHFDEVEVPDATSFDVLADAAGVDEELLRELNPHFLRGFTPVGERRVVRLPPGTAPAFEVNFAMVPPDERISFLEHSVASGETLTHISRRYSVPVAELAAANGSLDPRRLQVGQRLVVPVGGARAAARSDVAPTTAGADDIGSSAGSGAEDGGAEDPSYRHVVSRGDSLWLLARRYGVTVTDLRRWNALREGAVLRPGTELVVGAGLEASRPRVHRVGSGDTWGGIARQWGVGATELASANGRTIDDVIRVGEELRIP